MLGISPETSLTNPRQSVGITLRDVIFILFRRRWVVLALSLPIILLGGSSLFRQTGSYTASAKVVVELTKVDLPRWNTSNRNIDFDRELSTLFTIAMSVPVAEKAAAALQDSLEVIKSLDPNLIGLDGDVDLVDYLMGGNDVSVVGESSVLEFRFTSINPRISLMAVGALRDAFVSYQVHGRKNKKAVQFYQEQLDGVRTRIDSLLSERGAVLMANKYISLKDELKFDSGRLADLKSNLNKAIVDRRSLESKYNQLVTFLDGNPRNFPMGPEENRCNTLIYWRNTVSQHDDQLASILSVYTEGSDAAKRQRGLIQDSLDHLAREERSYVQSIRVAYQALQSREVTLQGQIDDLQAKSKNSPLVYQKVSLIDTQIGSIRGLMSDIQGKLGEVRLSEFADERVSNVVSLTDPELFSVISSSKTMLYFILIIIFSISLGIVAAFIIESLDHRFYEPRDVEDHLRLPVFASVTKVK